MRYRLIGAAERLDNGFDNDERRLSFLPMISFDVHRAATVHVDCEFYHQRGRNYWHTVPATAGAIVVPSLRWSPIDVNDRVATSPGASTEPQSSDHKV